MRQYLWPITVGIIILAAYTLASGDSCTTIGNQTICSDGSTYTAYGNQTFDNKGNVWTTIGNQTFGPKGQPYATYSAPRKHR